MSLAACTLGTAKTQLSYYFLFPWQIKKLLFSFVIQPVLGCMHTPPPPQKKGETKKTKHTPHTTTAFFQFNWFWLLPSPNPKLFKDRNENIIFKCTICFDPSPIWPVSLSPADMQYSEFTVKLLFTHTWSLYFVKDIVKSEGAKKASESEEIHREGPSVRLEVEVVGHISDKKQLEAPHRKKVTEWGRQKIVAITIFPYLNSKPRGLFKSVDTWKFQIHPTETLSFSISLDQGITCHKK